MAQAETGTDGAYRMTIENRYRQLANVRRDSKLLAALGVSFIRIAGVCRSCLLVVADSTSCSVLQGLYGIFKLVLASVPSVAYGERFR